MTEEEAKTKWCPFARTMTVALDTYVEAAPNRIYRRGADGEIETILQGSLCIGSDCMAWQWLNDAAFRARADRAYARDGQVLQPDTGYCGLAGSPR